jgi:hypothetical protein
MGCHAFVPNNSPQYSRSTAGTQKKALAVMYDLHTLRLPAGNTIYRLIEFVVTDRGYGKAADVKKAIGVADKVQDLARSQGQPEVADTIELCIKQLCQEHGIQRNCEPELEPSPN